MTIPKVNDGDLMKSVRENTINKMVDKVNTLATDVVVTGNKCVVDHRTFKYSTTSAVAGIGVELEPNEYAVRAVTRNYDATSKKGEFVPVTKLEYDRKTMTLTATVGTVRDGELFVEFWKTL